MNFIRIFLRNGAGKCLVLLFIAGIPFLSAVEESAPGEGELVLSPGLTVRPLQEGVWLAVHSFPWPANSLLVSMPDGRVLMADTPYTPEATALLLDWAEEKFGTRDFIAVNSHFHFDNLGGNAELIRRRIPVYGSYLTAELLAERGETVRRQMISWLGGPGNESLRQAWRRIPLAAPDHLFPVDQPPKLLFGSETVEIWFPGAAHSPDNLVVWFPRRRLLFGSCLVKSLADKTPGNTADADLEHWPTALELLKSRYPGVRTVVPGHGDPGDASLLDHSLSLFQASMR